MNLRLARPSSPAIDWQSAQSLRWRLPVSLGLLFLVALIAISGTTYYFALNQEQLLGQERQAEVAEHAVTDTLQFLQYQQARLLFFGSFAQYEQRTTEFAQSFLESNLTLLEIVYLDQTGRLIAEATRDQKLLASAENYHNLSWFTQAQAHRLYIAPVMRPPQGEPYLILSIRTEQGVVAGRLRLHALSDAIQQHSRGQTRSTYLLNQQQEIVAHSDLSQIGSRLNQAGMADLAAFLAAPPDQASDWRAHYQNPQGQWMIGAAARVPGYDWILLTEVSAQEVTAVNRTEPFQLAVGVVLFGLLATVLTLFLLYRQVLQPLEGLRHDVERIGHGDLQYRITPIKINEIGQIADTVNQMAGRMVEREQMLRQTHDELEQRVAERTAELAAANEELRLENNMRQQMEDALRTSEQRYRILFESAPIALFTKDRTGRYTSVNAEELKYWEKNPVGLHDRDLVSAEEAQLIQDLDLQVLSTGQPVTSEQQVQTVQGLRTFLSYRVPLLDKAGEIEGILGTSLDITERRQTEMVLQDSVARMRLIADNLPALIAYVDHQQIYQFANKRFEEWYQSTDIVGRHLRDVAGEPAYEGIQGYVDMALAGVEINFEYSRTYPDNRLRHVEISYIPHIGPDDKVLGFFTLVQDLTERREAEAKIRESLDEKVVLLKEIHHRVKNNLQVVSSLLYLQAERITDGRLREILQDSQNRVKSMALIHEKLYQTKDLAQVNVAEYIRNLTSYLFHSYSSQAGNVQLHVRADNISLGIDSATPCGLIINELLSNSLKHGFPNNRPGEIYIELNMEANGIYTLIIGDNGVGFPADLDFQQTSSLGLQLVHTLVRQLNGTIELVQNNGVEFRIQFAELN